MDTRSDKEIDQLIRELLQNSELERPSEHFTNNVMHEIDHLATIKKKVSRPLIPHFVWASLIAIYVCVVSLLFHTNLIHSAGWFSALNNWSSSAFSLDYPQFEFSGALFYGVLCFSFLLMAQVVMLRKKAIRQ
jgi:hypothetical protein